ncbi:dicarboxylate/amino acid:cation symporter [Membranicola marinus]|uniref:Dicarboxylate/amino acid:cation symporter n=1 Tax=Membranihabitans marinus TaxID=1227546 RepID=A0A953HJL9_9BACT|nr:dicarboxylate/amino acid:cation symporter [Membranihabitans marinus]MBY5957084.1 dicarboxylate/amino acid:cation symporter [Membranihabitans marinus]
MKRLALHWQILLGMVLGIVVGFVAVQLHGENFISNWIDPFGVIFINLLKLIAVPLIIASLLNGIADLKDISKLSKMGTRTILIYIVSTVLAITIGLISVNLIQPGYSIEESTRDNLLESYAGDASSRIEAAMSQKDQGPLQPLIDLIPDNIFLAATDNGSMLQVIFVVILFGIALILIDPKKAEPIKEFIGGVNEVVLKIIDMIMLGAPYGVFALMASLVVDAPSLDLFQALLWYGFTVLMGLAIMIFVIYPLAIKIFTGYSYRKFFNGISPAQLLAFSTSSSAATLPVTMERVTEHIGVDEEVSSFVLPVGATINMDGTSLYQAVAAIFIAQALSIDLTFMDQLTIVVTATLASIGSAAVPGAGMVMLVIVLSSVGIPEAGLALIFAVDRPLDMCRTIVNVTGDASVSMIVAKSLGKLGVPVRRDLKDHYKPAHERVD